MKFKVMMKNLITFAFVKSSMRLSFPFSAQITKGKLVLLCKRTSAVTMSVTQTQTDSETGQRTRRDVWSLTQHRCSHSSNEPTNLADAFVKQQNSLLKNDPEIKVWMNQIAQDTEKSRELFETHDNHIHNDSHNDNPSHSSQTLGTGDENLRITEVNDTDTPLEIEDFGYLEDDGEVFEEVAPEKPLPISLNRGRGGVFDVDEMVAVLRAENGVDIKVIDIPPEARFVDHMVIVSGKSHRHMQAMAATIEWIYKRKKAEYDKDFKLEGRNCKRWLAMDLGNIAVHIFTPEAREYYDLETLWTLGPEHDDQRHYIQDDNLNLSAEDLFWLESGWKKESPTKSENAVHDETITLVDEESDCNKDGLKSASSLDTKDRVS